MNRKKYLKDREKFDKKWLKYEAMDLDLHLIQYLKSRLEKLYNVEMSNFYEYDNKREITDSMKKIIDLCNVYLKDYTTFNYEQDRELEEEAKNQAVQELLIELGKIYAYLWY